MSRIFSAFANEDADVGFVGCFIVGKPRVAIDAVRAVFHRKTCNCAVKLGNACNQIFGECVDVFLNGFVARFVSREPVSVVIFGEFFEERDDGFHDSH